MIRHLVLEVVVKLLIGQTPRSLRLASWVATSLTVAALVAACGPVHFGIAEYRASLGASESVAPAERPSAPAIRSSEGIGGGGLASANAVSPPSDPNAVVAVRLLDAGVSRSGAWVSFPEAFRQGQLPQGSGIVARVGGREVPAQLDVQSKYPDGSARIGVVTAEASGEGEIVLLRR